MKVSYANKFFFGIFLSCMFFSPVALNGCAGNPFSANTPMKIRGEKEILVARDIGGGLPYSLMWCGNTALLAYGGEFGTVWVGLDENRVTISTKSTDYPRNCTPDGKWVIYEDRDSARIYKDTQGRLPENIVDEGPGWHGFVMDLYRYEISTGARQRFAVVRDDSGSLVSPDGTRVLLGNRHDSAIEMPKPKWETVWLTNEWTYYNEYWLPDSSGIVMEVWNAGASLGVEFFGKERWSKEFSLDMLRSGPGTNVSLAAVDESNVLHFVAVKDYPVGDYSRSIYNFFRCKIKHRDLICDLTGGIEEEEDDENILSLDLLPNEDIIFKREEDNCIRRVKRRETVAECIADTRYNNEIYIGIDLIGISPDGRWIAIRRGKLPPEPEGRFYTYQYDLFVIDLKEE
ncbi:MAG TPA: hypothetical protein VJM57_01530 [Thermodesulfobacteriota bacterium]|nr:hypothetical protein [Thermodesulfobacteriota bacterium]